MVRKASFNLLFSHSFTTFATVIGGLGSNVGDGHLIVIERSFRQIHRKEVRGEGDIPAEYPPTGSICLRPCSEKRLIRASWLPWVCRGARAGGSKG